MVRRFRVVLALCAALVATALIAPPAVAVGTNTVVFTATDPDGNPIAITAWVGNGSGASGRTAASGTTTWTGLDDGDYSLFISADSMDGYRIYYDGSATGSPTPPATLTHLAGGQNLDFTVQFPRLATLSGTVTGCDGNASNHSAVTLNRGGSVKSVYTDASGHYDFGYLRSGNVTLTAHPVAGCVAAPSRVITVPSSGVVTENFSLAVAASLDGTLTNAADGLPLADLGVAAYAKVGASVQYVNSTRSDASGHFHLSGLIGTDYVLQFSDPLGGGLRSLWWSGNADTSSTATTISVPEGSASTHDEAVVYPDPSSFPHTLSGEVSGPSGGKLAGISVTATDGTDTVETSTDRNGRWALSVADGSWTLRAASGPTLEAAEAGPPWYPQYFTAGSHADTAAMAQPVIVASGVPVDSLNTSLNRSARLRVSVTTPSGGAVTPHWRLFTPAGSALPAPPTDANGHPLLRPGSYKLLVTGEAGGTILLPRWHTSASSATRATTVTVTTGEDRSTSISLAAALIALSNPGVTGSLMVGSTLTATNPGWSLETSTTVSGVWKRNGSLRASGPRYTLTAADAGATISYAATATNTAFGKTFVASAQTRVVVAKLASSTAMKAKALGSKKVRLTITVTAPGLSPSGTVTIRRGSIVVGTAQVTAGKATLTVKKQPRGSKTYRATFNGSTQTLTSLSPKAKVKVR